MPKSSHTASEHLLAGLAVACLITTSATATDFKAGKLTISDPWSRATPKGAQTAIGYMTIRNDGLSPERLVGGSIEIADHFQLHAMKMEGDVAKMKELHDIEIKPGERVEFKPGGSHVMFVGLKSQMAKGEHIKGTLVFEHAGTVSVEYSVEGIGAKHIEGMQH
jgi:periplasmic copper chaperone A